MNFRLDKISFKNWDKITNIKNNKTRYKKKDKNILYLRMYYKKFNITQLKL